MRLMVYVGVTRRHRTVHIESAAVLLIFVAAYEISQVPF